MALTSRVYARIETEQAIAAAPATARSEQTVAMSFALLDGLGAGKADVTFAAAREIAILGDDDIDLNGALQDVFGGTINAAQVKAILIGAEASNVGNIVLGGAGGTFTGPLGGTNPSVMIPPGGVVMYADRGVGWSSAAGTSDILRVSNASSGVAKYQVIVVAASAVLPAPSNITLPAIAGVAQVGQTLSASSGTWTNAPIVYAYQWRRGGTAIPGANASTYVLVSDDIGQTLTCTVTATNGGGSTPATTAATAAVIAAGSAPVNTVAPAISGTAQVGQTLLASNGAWTGSPTSYAYQWNKAGVAISGANASNYSPISGDIGAVVTCTVTATNAFGSTSATSSGVTISAVGFTPSADFSDSRNSQYVAAFAA